MLTVKYVVTLEIMVSARSRVELGPWTLHNAQLQLAWGM